MFSLSHLGAAELPVNQFREIRGVKQTARKPRLRKAAEATSDAEDAWHRLAGFMLGCSFSQYHQLGAHSCGNGLCSDSQRTSKLQDSGLVVRTPGGENQVKGAGGKVPWCWCWVLNIVPTRKSTRAGCLGTSHNLGMYVHVCRGCLCSTGTWGKGKWRVANSLFQCSNDYNLLLGKPWFMNCFLVYGEGHSFYRDTPKNSPFHSF